MEILIYNQLKTEKLFEYYIEENKKVKDNPKNKFEGKAISNHGSEYDQDTFIKISKIKIDVLMNKEGRLKFNWSNNEYLIDKNSVYEDLYPKILYKKNSRILNLDSGNKFLEKNKFKEIQRNEDFKITKIKTLFDNSNNKILVNDKSKNRFNNGICKICNKIKNCSFIDQNDNIQEDNGLKQKNIYCSNKFINNYFIPSNAKSIYLFIDI